MSEHLGNHTKKKY